MKPLPSKQEILEWIKDNPNQATKRDIARAFGLKGARRVGLKDILRELESEGALAKRKSRYQDPKGLPPVTVLRVEGPDDAGDLFARPVQWEGQGDRPRALVLAKAGETALAAGDRILAKLERVDGGDFSYEARLIRKIGTAPNRILGLFRKTSQGGRVIPVEKGTDRQWQVPAGETNEARDGELIEAEQIGPKDRLGLPKARVVARLGDPTAPRAVSLIAIHEHRIPDRFPDAVLVEVESAQDPSLGDREDLREMPFVTIDPHDARDRDDAILALSDPDPKNAGGFILWVAIADVAAYVRQGTELDREARLRGNSTYFPDRVVPMLPDTLSGDLCSLHDSVDRAAMAVEMRIDSAGNKIGHRFTRCLIRSVASLNYQEVQAGMEGAPNDKVAPLMDDVIRPIFAAYDALKRARAKRQPLELDLPERQILLNEDGQITTVAFKERLDAHKLIEEYMVLANVAAAEELVRRRTPLLFRVHEEPSPDKLEALREVAGAAGLTLAKGQVLKTQHLNQLLRQAEGSDDQELINLSTLRSMTQAYYAPKNFAHFGLALKNYAHFTSPIRRYADLIVHRALIRAHGWGDDGLTDTEIDQLDATGQHISNTERRSMMAERDTTDRYLAAFLSDRIGAELHGRISGIAKFGVFVRLADSGADALVPIRSLGDEYFRYVPEARTLQGEASGLMIGIGMEATVKLTEAVPVTGGIVVELLTVSGDPLPKGGRTRRRGAPTKRAASKARRKAAIKKKKIKRTRR